MIGVGSSRDSYICSDWSPPVDARLPAVGGDTAQRSRVAARGQSEASFYFQKEKKWKSEKQICNLQRGFPSASDEYFFGKSICLPAENYLSKGRKNCLY